MFDFGNIIYYSTLSSDANKFRLNFMNKNYNYNGYNGITTNPIIMFDSWSGFGGTYLNYCFISASCAGSLILGGIPNSLGITN